MSFAEKFSYEDTEDIDASGRLRVSNPLTIFDSKQIYDNQPLFWDELLESGAGITSSHSADGASTTLTSTLNTAGLFTRQTFRRFNYQTGKGQFAKLTGVIDQSGGGTGVQRRLGYFDDDNGLFFEDDEGTIKVVRRTNVTGTPVDNKVAQSSWNVDQMDGAGPSGVTIDWTKIHLFFMDFEWLSASRCRLGLKVAGELWVVHEFLVANVLDEPFMSTPNLPLRFQMVTTGASPASTMKCTCGTVISDGGAARLGVLRYRSTEGTHIDMTTENVVYAVIGLRLKTTHLGAQVSLVSMSLGEYVGSKQMEWILFFNPSIAGVFAYGDETNSSLQTAVGTSTSVVTGGTKIGGGHWESAGGQAKGGSTVEELENALMLGASIAGTQDQIVLAVRPIAGSSAIDVEGSLTWRESP
jgi:hypothetical protein